MSTGTIRDQIDTVRDNAKCHSTLYVIEMLLGTIEVKGELTESLNIIRESNFT